MKKVLLALIALVVIGIASGMFLVEEWIEGDVECPLPEQIINRGDDSLKVTLTLLYPAFATFNYGIEEHKYWGWLKIDGTEVPFSTCHVKSSLHYEFEDVGEHVVELWWKGGEGTIVRDPLLQALVFLQVPDSNNNVSERPSEEDEVQVSSVLTVGPMVRVPGCQAVVDATGRTIDCVIEGDQVSVNSLPIGTYFATGSNGRTTKIVKLK